MAEHRLAIYRIAAFFQIMSNREPIRVLQIITRMILGGAQEHALLLAEGLDRLPDYEVTFVSGVDQGREGELLSRTRETTHLIVVPELGRNINPFSDVVALWKLYRLIKRGRYHVVNTHSSKAGVLGRIAAKMAGTPIVVHTLHGLGLNDYQPWVINRLWWAVKKFCAPMTDHYASVSNIISQKAINLGIARQRSSVRSTPGWNWTGSSTRRLIRWPSGESSASRRTP
jgi:hypothetical protein